MRPFTVSVGIKFADFDALGSSDLPVITSPNGRFVAIRAERGLLAKNRVEDELRVWDTAQLTRYVSGRSGSRVPRPVLDLREATYRQEPIMSQITWLPDSSGVAFLFKTKMGKNSLVTVTLGQRKLRFLSRKEQDVTEFDIRDAWHYAYAVFSPWTAERGSWRRERVSTSVDDQDLGSLLFPAEYQEGVRELRGALGGLRSVLWAATGGAPHLVVGRERQQPLVIYSERNALALSPDGRTVATALPVPVVPESWLREFQAPYAPYSVMRAGSQSLRVSFGWSFTDEYALINVESGNAKAIVDSPTGSANGFGAGGRLVWSNDGSELLLPDVYLSSPHSNGSDVRPCIAILHPATGAIDCLERLRAIMTTHGTAEPGFFFINSVNFENNRPDRVILHYEMLEKQWVVGPERTKVFAMSAAKEWQVSPSKAAPEFCENRPHVEVQQGLNEPPVVVVKNPCTGASRVLWDPNRGLKHVSLGRVTSYRWTDATGRQWTGGLYVPADYAPGRRYPAVIQTHGFSKDLFSPSGMFPTAFAARALAASGIVVLQLPLCGDVMNPKEGPCNVALYDGAVKELVGQGLIDPRRIGIIGFSRTVYHVLDALTSGSTHFAAASITDGPDEGIWQYLAGAATLGQFNERDAGAVIGAPPFGSGLRLWAVRSPEFNMEKVKTPLLVVAPGRIGILEMWGPFAALRTLKKPVDMVIINTHEHVLTQPAARMASQGGSVDWFRFWLQGYESPEPAKAQQYRRWEKLCDMQRSETRGTRVFCVSTRAATRDAPKG
jgi:hypothetical protein